MASSTYLKQFPKQLLIKTWQTPGINTLAKTLWRSIATRDRFIPLFSRYCSTQLKPLNQVTPAKPGEKHVRLLVLNAHRFAPDIQALGQQAGLELIELPARIQSLINALFHWKIRGEFNFTSNWDNNSLYYKAKTPLIQQVRNDLRQYLVKFIDHFSKQNHLDGLMSCAYHYVRDLEWQQACQELGINFFALHKECMKDPVLHESLIQRYSTAGVHFYGQRMFLYNKLCRDVVLAANICKPEVIKVVGSARFDTLYQRVKESKGLKKPKAVTLFSSHHCIGVLSLKNNKGYFSRDRSEGFVEYFDAVHAQVARYAMQHPEVPVYIKPKWGGGWFEKIRDAINRGLGVEADSISNLIITDQVDAQELIERSQVLIGINSTALLEAKLYGRRVIVPLFLEAAGKYYEKNVYFKNYEDVFTLARIPEQLPAVIDDEYHERLPEREMPAAMIEDYLGYFDGQSCQRILKQIRQDIAALDS